jgi:hypothetical protein
MKIVYFYLGGGIVYLKKGQDYAVTAYYLRPLEKSRYRA